MIRVGISGTNWTGKTTSINQLCSTRIDCRIEVVTLSEYVSRCPHPMGENQTPEGSRWMFEQIKAKLRESSAADLQVFDRTPLDILAYTTYAFAQTRQEPDESLLSEIRELLGGFRHLFYAAPGEEWPVGVAPAPHEIGLALLMDWYMRRLLRKHGIQVVCLPWNLDERCSVLDQLLTE